MPYKLPKNGWTTPEVSMIVDNILLAIGLFWVTWTSKKNIT